MKVPEIKKNLADFGYYHSTDFSNRQDGSYDKAVRNFQSDHTDLNGVQLVVDGIPGEKTIQVIEYFKKNNITRFWSIDKKTAEREVLSFISQKVRGFIPKKIDGHKSEFDILDGLKVEDGLYIIAKDRKPPRSRSEIRPYLRSFSGAAVLVRVVDGKPSIIGSPIRIATHPGQDSTSLSDTPDVNGDKIKDIAWTIPNMQYTFHPKRSGTRKRFNPIGSVSPVNRDYQTKGYIDEDEARSIFSATMIQYHSDENKENPISVGCFTSPQKDYDRMAKWIESQEDKFFTIIFRYT